MPRSSHTVDQLARSLDFACILLAFAGASGIASLLAKIHLFIWPEVPGASIRGWPTNYVVLLIASLILWAMVAAYEEVHKVDRIESSQHSYWRLMRALVLWLGTTAASIFFLKLQIVSRQFNLSFFSLASCLILFRQFVERALISRRTLNERSLRRALVIGPKREADWLVDVLASKPEWYGTIESASFDRVKALLCEAEESTNNDVESSPGEIFIFSSCSEERAVRELTLRALQRGKTVHVIPALIDAQLFRQNLGDISGVPTLTLGTGNTHDLELAIKRTADVVAGALLLLAFSPVMFITAALIKFTSPGPVLFRQQRLGKGGRPFTILKYRTMRPDAEEMLKKDTRLYRRYVENNFKLPEGEDLRVTRLGRILRATSLDELPQLINVIKGEMSLVGPRPIVPEELKKYGDYAALLGMVKPGMTGNWQVSGRSRIVEYSDRVKLDMEYVRDQSFGEDVRILFRTVAAVAKMDGAH